LILSIWSSRKRKKGRPVCIKLASVYVIITLLLTIIVFIIIRQLFLFYHKLYVKQTCSQKLWFSYNVYIAVIVCVSYTCTIANTTAKLAKPQTFGFRFEPCKVWTPVTTAFTISVTFHGIIPYTSCLFAIIYSLDNAQPTLLKVLMFCWPCISV